MLQEGGRGAPTVWDFGVWGSLAEPEDRAVTARVTRDCDQTTAATGALLHGKPLNLTGDSGPAQTGQETQSLTLEGVNLNRSTGKTRTTG